MYSKISGKLRSLINDVLKTDGSEIFTYSTSKIFKLLKENATATTAFKINDILPDSGETISFNASSNEATIVADLTAKDEIEIQYSYYNKYSEADIQDYIRSALVYISVYSECEDYELELDGDNNYQIEPTPSNLQSDIIVLVAGILIKPNWVKYKLPDVELTFPRTQTKETRIIKLITGKVDMTGTTDLLEWET